jgi:hypothetical protein
MIDGQGLTPAIQAQLSAGVVDYVNGPLTDRWRSSLRSGGRAVDSSFELLSRARVEQWLARRGAETVKQQTEQQRAALRQILAGGLQTDRATMRAAIRATVGLTERQARSLRALSVALAEDDVSPQRWRAALERAALRAQRIRADRIARTEIASAFNGGVEESIQGGLDSGTFATAEKTWRTQGDRRVDCAICKELNGETVPVGQSFEGLYMTPPAHPNCRCVLLYQVT